MSMSQYVAHNMHYRSAKPVQNQFKTSSNHFRKGYKFLTFLNFTLLINFGCMGMHVICISLWAYLGLENSTIGKSLWMMFTKLQSSYNQQSSEISAVVVLFSKGSKTFFACHERPIPPPVLIGSPFYTNHRKLLIDIWAELYRFYYHPSDPFNDFYNSDAQLKNYMPLNPIDQQLWKEFKILLRSPNCFKLNKKSIALALLVLETPFLTSWSKCLLDGLLQGIVQI